MKYWVLIILLVPSVLVFGQGKVFVIPDSLVNSDKIMGISLKPYVSYLPGSMGKLTIDQVAQKHLSDRYRPAFDKEFDQDSTYWFRLEFQLPKEGFQKFFLRFSRLTIDLYDPNSTGEFILKRNGPYVPPGEKDVIFDMNNFFELSLLNTKPKVIYYKLSPNRPLAHIYPVIYTSGPFEDLFEFRKLKNLVFITIALSMMIYNFFLYTFSKEKLYVYYLLFVGFTGLFITSIEYYPHFLPRPFVVHGMLITLNLALFFLLMFSVQFLRLKQYNLLYQIVKVVMLGCLLLILPFVYYLIRWDNFPGIWETISIGWALVPIMMILIASLIALSKGFRPAIYFLVANGIFIATSLTALFFEFFGKELRWVEYTWPFSREFVFGLGGIGLMSQVVLYGIAIGYKILRLEKDRSIAIEEKLDTQETINLQLEQKVTERTAQLEHRNRENELLLGEIHHRVKNNLQVISSLLKLQSRQLDDGKAKNAVLEGRDRVKAMALIHQRLYQQDWFSAIEMHDYVLNLVENLAQSYGFVKSNFRLDLEVPELHLDVDSAIPIGLIINELVSNAFKHAFQPDRENQLTIKLQEEVNSLILEVQDNGPGMIAKSKDASSFGLQLIEALTEELKGQVIYENGQGTSVRLIIKEYKILATT